MSEVALAPLSSLWSAMAPRRPAAATPLPDVGAIAAAAETHGRADGRAAAETELEPLRTILSASIGALEAAREIDAAALQPLFVELVTRIASAVIDGELRQSPEVVGRLVEATLAAVTTDGATVIRLSVDDAARMSGDPRVVADPELASGELRVETPQHIVAASLDARLMAILCGLA